MTSGPTLRFSNRTITVAALVYTGLILVFSKSFHRLSFPATFDDVNYFIDGAERLSVLWKDGPLALLDNLVVTPPHSPGSTLLSLLAFTLFGFEDFAPYAINFLNVWLYLKAVNYLIESAPAVSKFALTLLALTPAFLPNAILEFRPDFLSAVLFCTGAFSLLNTDSPSYRSAIYAGLWTAAAIVCKPTTAPFTIPLAACVALSRLAILFCRKTEHKTSLGKLLHTPVIFFAISLLPLIVYFCLNGRHVINYIGETFNAQGTTWVRQGSFISLIAYHFTGESGQMQLGSSGLLTTFGVLAVAAIMIVYFLPKDDRLLVLAHSFVLFIAILGAGLASVANPFSGLIPQIYMILLLLYCCTLATTLAPRIAQISVIAFAFAGVLQIKLPYSYAWLNTATSSSLYGLRDLNHEVDKAIRSNRSGPTSKVLFTFVSYFLQPYTFDWESIKKGEAQRFSCLPLYSPTAPIAALNDELRDSELVLTASPQTFSTLSWLKNYAGELQGEVSRNPEFALLTTWQIQNGGEVSLYKRIGFGGWKTITGLGHSEGPYPQWRMPLVAWGLTPATRIQLHETQQNQRLNLSYAGNGNRGTLTILFDEKPLWSGPIDPNSNFKNLDITLPVVVPNSTLILKYSLDSPSPDNSRAVLFRSLTIR